ELLARVRAAAVGDGEVGVVHLLRQEGDLQPLLERGLRVGGGGARRLGRRLGGGHVAAGGAAAARGGEHGEAGREHDAEPGAEAQAPAATRAPEGTRRGVRGHRDVSPSRRTVRWESRRRQTAPRFGASTDATSSSPVTKLRTSFATSARMSALRTTP